MRDVRRSLWVLVLAVLLFAAVTALRFSTTSIGDGYSLLYVVPISLVALQFGFIPGLIAATTAMLLFDLWVELEDAPLTLAGFLTRALTFLVLGGLVGYVAQQRQRLMGQVEDLARTDWLTGLMNRRAWEDELQREMARARRGGFPFGVALLDLDRFKAFNDQRGHPAGDALLRAVAQSWQANLRSVDTLARYGGEEFVVLLPGCPPADARDVIERLRSVTPAQQTASAGIAEWDGEETPHALMSRADKALYEAKKLGRDRCVLAARDAAPA